MSLLLKGHLDAVEQSLLVQSKIPANSGHSLHKGTPRETFIKAFLEGHLSERVAIGHGEIIDAESKPNENRNQMDIIIYKRNYPRIDFGGDIYGFLAESVVATIEVKSTLTKDDLKMAVRAAHNTKKMQRHTYSLMYSGYQPPGILSYLVAYDGPAQMNTVYSWLNPIHTELNIAYPEMGKSLDERLSVASPSLDGMFVLGKGFLFFDNSPLGFEGVERVREMQPETRWFFTDLQTGSLAFLFFLLTNVINTMADTYLDPYAYLPKLGFQTLHYGP